MPQPNAILQSNIPGLAIGDYEIAVPESTSDSIQMTIYGNSASLSPGALAYASRSGITFELAAPPPATPAPSSPIVIVNGSTGPIYINASINVFGNSATPTVIPANSYITVIWGGRLAPSWYATDFGTGPSPAAPVPVNTVAPTLSGTAQVGSVLTADTGTWTESPTSFTYQFIDTATGTLQQAGASNAYTIQASDAGGAIYVIVFATNGNGTASAYSQPSAPIAAPSGPTNTALPTLSGTAQVGSALTLSNGTWNGSPTSFTYEFFRQSTGISVQGPGASSSYTCQAGDVGTSIYGVVVATNGSGSTSAQSATSATVTAATPLPNIPAGVVTVGNLLTTDSAMLNPASGIWDTVAGGGSPVHGTCNGGLPSDQANIFQDSSGYLHIAVNAPGARTGSGIWATSQRNGQAGNASGGGAPTGFVLPNWPNKWVIEFSIKTTGQDGTHAYYWSSPWLQSRQASGSTNYEEIDVYEGAGWSGSGSPGLQSLTYHWDSTLHATIYPTSPHLSDGNWHEVTLVYDPPNSVCHIYWDGVEVTPGGGWPLEVPNVQQVIQLTTGYSGSSLIPANPATGDLIFRWIRAWAAS